jgi:hypothetical protein
MNQATPICRWGGFFFLRPNPTLICHRQQLEGCPFGNVANRKIDPTGALRH